MQLLVIFTSLKLFANTPNSSLGLADLTWWESPIFSELVRYAEAASCLQTLEDKLILHCGCKCIFTCAQLAARNFALTAGI